MKLEKSIDKIFIITVLLISAFQVMAQHAYNPLIRYDRVWESTTTVDSHDYSVKYMRFDGTEEVNGKIYHRIISCQKNIFRYNEATKQFNITDVNDDICELEGYLREEGGKVYTLSQGQYSDNRWCGILYPYEFPNDGDIISEFLLYDFTCEKGEWYEAISNFTRSAELVNFTPVSKEVVDIDGEQCFHIGVGTFINDQGFSNYEIIEGIGPVNWGSLHYNEWNIPSKIWEYNYFNRVFDTSGRVIYERPEAYEFSLPENLFSEVGALEENTRLHFVDEQISYGDNSGMNSISIFNLSGCEVVSVSGAGRQTLSTTGLQPGVYIAIGGTRDQLAVHGKFIVK